MSDDAGLAQALATINSLRAQLAQQTTALADAESRMATVQHARDEATTALAAERDGRAKDKVAADAAVQAAVARATAADRAAAQAKADADKRVAAAAADLAAEKTSHAGDRAALDAANAAVAQAQAEREAAMAEATKAAQAHTAALAEADDRTAAALADRDKARADYVALSNRTTEPVPAEPKLLARVAELEALLLADPPAGSGIVKTTRYMTNDGRKHKLLPDAKRHAGWLGVMASSGLTETQADAVLSQRDAMREYFDLVDGKGAEAVVAVT